MFLNSNSILYTNDYLHQLDIILIGKVLSTTMNWNFFFDIL